MISHELRCILVHIPRTGGTSIEKVLVGSNWWKVDARTKHMLASQARKIYSQWWNEYLKFAVVRNPWCRHLSMLRFGSVYYGKESGVLSGDMLNLYKSRLGYTNLIEHDYRFYDRKDLARTCHTAGSVYGNILDEELDLVIRYEELEDGYSELCKLLDIPRRPLEKTMETPAPGLLGRRRRFESISVVRQITELYSRDLDRYGYSCDEPCTLRG